MKTFLQIRKLFIVSCLVLCLLPDIFGQQNFVVSGGNLIGSGGSVSYSLGQINYLTGSGSGGTFNEGVQQPFEIFVVGGIEETNINLSLSVYPNPTKDFLVLNVRNFNTQNMTYILYDMQGRLIEKQKLNGSQNNISMVDLANGIYFISVFNRKMELKKFKIIKNN